jgi:hypothetical protein
MPFMDRPSFIQLLDRLGSEKDEDALAAAREIDRRMKNGKVAWDDLLVPVGGAKGEAGKDDGDYARDAYERDAEPETVNEEQAERDLALINELLASDKISEGTRDELKDFVEDIAQKRLRPADSRYVQSLHKRLLA